MCTLVSESQLKTKDRNSLRARLPNYINNTVFLYSYLLCKALPLRLANFVVLRALAGQCVRVNMHANCNGACRTALIGPWV